ncbi:MAG: DUF924 domain-containing protein [Bacteriovoracaceae bacterium]|nr:DUF924 domain-containing protein [Bacteriovoracaceae bacterium]
MEFRDVLAFWFEDLKPQEWFQKSDELDKAICDKFGALHKAATLGELEEWRSTPRGRLAEILVLDQFSRNIHRGKPESFASDSMALVLAQEAIRQKSHQELSAPKRAFLYMPYMHSESKKIHREAMELFGEPGLEFNLNFEVKHKKIIDRFDRYPHRNEILGRTSTSEELEFLKEEGSSF